MQAARRIEHQDIIALKLGGLQRTPSDIDRLLPRDNRQGRDANLGAKHGKLLLRGRTIHVERRHHHLSAVFFRQAFGDLGSGCCLARTLQPDHHDDRGRGNVQIKLCRFAAQHFNQRIIDDLDDLLPRRDRLEHLRSNRLGRHTVHERADDWQSNVGLKQGNPYFAHGGAHVCLVQGTASAQAIKDAA